MRSSLPITLCVLLMTGGLSACRTAPVPPSAPSAPSTSGQEWTVGWQAFALPGKRPTLYTPEHIGGRWVVHAQADRSAAMFRRQLRIEPESLGKLSFSWKAAALVPEGDVRDSDVEDAPLRVLLAFDGDHSRLSQRTRMMFDLMHGLTGEVPPYATLMYVWDGKAPVDSLVVNRRSDRVRKIVVESGAQHIGQWRSYSRDIVADYRRAFGADPGALIAVALMTDTDNTQTRAQAWYGEPRLLARPEP